MRGRSRCTDRPAERVADLHGDSGSVQLLFAELVAGG